MHGFKRGNTLDDEGGGSRHYRLHANSTVIERLLVLVKKEKGSLDY